MTDDDPAAYRAVFDPPADETSVREAEEVEADEGMMEIRMPIASSGQVRNEGDDPLSGAELRGMAQQIDTLSRGVFPEHGTSTAVDNAQYSQFEKLGYWADADLQREASTDGEDLLMATARMPDPETLPAATGDYRQSLAILKEQAKRGIPISSSIGWRNDEEYPGGVDLMEASIVGIGADPRTNTDGGTEALARAAVEAGADPEAFVAEVRNIVLADADRDGDTDTEDSHDMTDDDTPPDGGTTDDEQSADDGDTTERSDMNEAEYRQFMRDQQEQQTEILRTLAESLREDAEDEEEDDEDEDDDEEEQSSDPDETQAADTDDAEERSADGDDSDLEERLAELESELEAVRSGDAEVVTPDRETDAEQSADADDSEESEADAEPTRTATSPTDGLGDYR